MTGKSLMEGQTPVVLESREQRRTGKKHNFSVLLESKLRNRNHGTNSKQKLELHQDEKRNDEPGFTA